MLAPALAAIVQCGSPSAPVNPQAVFRVRACVGSIGTPEGQVFRVLLRDSRLIAQARALTGMHKIVAGTVVSGDGGFNAPWSWHLDPGTVQIVDAAIELCDACPSYVETHLASWVGATFCPWSAEILGEQK